MQNLLTILVIGLLAGGCSSESRSVATAPPATPDESFAVEVLIRIPGAGAEEIDELVASAFIRDAAAIHGVQQIMGVAKDGTFEGYIKATATDAAAVATRAKAALPHADLPASAEGIVVRHIDEMPQVAPTTVPVIHIELDREKLNMFGLTQAEVMRVLPHLLLNIPASNATASDLGLLIVTTRHGHSVRLTDIATLTMRNRVSTIIRRYPSEQTQMDLSSVPMHVQARWLRDWQLHERELTAALQAQLDANHVPDALDLRSVILAQDAGLGLRHLAARAVATQLSQEPRGFAQGHANRAGNLYAVWITANDPATPADLRAACDRTLAAHAQRLENRLKQLHGQASDVPDGYHLFNNWHGALEFLHALAWVQRIAHPDKINDRQLLHDERWKAFPGSEELDVRIVGLVTTKDEPTTLADGFFAYVNTAIPLTLGPDGTPLGHVVPAVRQDGTVDTFDVKTFGRIVERMNNQLQSDSSSIVTIDPRSPIGQTLGAHTNATP